MGDDTTCKTCGISYLVFNQLKKAEERLQSNDANTSKLMKETDELSARFRQRDEDATRLQKELDASESRNRDAERKFRGYEEAMAALQDKFRKEEGNYLQTMDTLLASKKDLVSQLDALRGFTSSFGAEFDMMKTAFGDVLRFMNDEATATVDDLRDHFLAQIKLWEAKEVGLISEIADVTTQLQASEAKAESFRVQLELSAEEQQQHAHARVREMEATLAAQKDTIAQLQQKLDQAATDALDTELRMAAEAVITEERIRRMEADVASARLEAQRVQRDSGLIHMHAETSMNEYKAESSKLRTQVTTLLASTEDMRKLMTNRETQLDKMTREMRVVKDEVAARDHRIEDLQLKLTSTSEQLHETKAQLNTETHELRERNRVMQAEEVSRNAMMQRLQDESDEQHRLHMATVTSLRETHEQQMKQLQQQYDLESETRRITTEGRIRSREEKLEREIQNKTDLLIEARNDISQGKLDMLNVVSAREALQQMFDQLRQVHDRTCAELDLSRAELQRALERLADFERERTETHALLQERQTQIEHLTASLDSETQQKSGLTDQLNALRQTAEAMQQMLMNQGVSSSNRTLGRLGSFRSVASSERLQVPTLDTDSSANLQPLLVKSGALPPLQLPKRAASNQNLLPVAGAAAASGSQTDRTAESTGGTVVQSSVTVVTEAPSGSQTQRSYVSVQSQRDAFVDSMVRMPSTLRHHRTHGLR
eukprot:TRINITY_DN11539_c0_g5_i1.p1 TRINITY_DN11539_c0_g5~~TRINITY_DN11539_c0_g5_i1.p1  ORF type:complete len:715 (+),score=193.91 TRINITY_DN11539_c0_g5_i1:103-2247(+)